MFSTDVRSAEEPPSGLSVNEYIAIGVCSVLLGLIYVASIMLYLHIRKRRRKSRDKDAESAHLTVEEGWLYNVFQRGGLRVDYDLRSGLVFSLIIDIRT